MWKVTTWIHLTLVLAILAAALHVAGFVAPMWIWLDVDSFEVGVGLWFSTGCGLQAGTCGTSPPDTSFEYVTSELWPRPEFTAVRVLETVGVAGSILLVLFLIIYRFGYDQWAKIYQLNLAACFTAIITWLCIMAGLIVYCGYFWSVVGTSPLLSSASFPWSIVMCLFAAFFFIVVSLLIRIKCRDRSNHLKHAIPISGDSKFDAHPLTKHGLIHRFFLPIYLGIRGNNTRDTGYLTYQTENVNHVHTMNTRLVEAEEHNHLPAIDHAAFYDNGMSEESNYRYLPHQRDPSPTEPAIPRSLPTAVVTYSGHQNADHHSPQAARPNLDLLLRHVGDGPRGDVNYRDDRVASARHGVMDRHGDEVILRADAAYQARRDLAYQAREDAAGEVTYARVPYHADGVTPRDSPPQDVAFDHTGVAGSRDVWYHGETVTRNQTIVEGSGNAGVLEAHNHHGQGHLQDSAYRSGDLMRRDGAFEDVQDSEATRHAVRHAGQGTTFHSQGHLQEAAYRSADVVRRDGAFVDVLDSEATQHGVHRVGHGATGAFHGEARGRDAAYQNVEETETRGANYRSVEESETRGAAYRSGEEADSRGANYRSSDMVTRDASGNVMTEEHITTTTTTTYITEGGRQKRAGGLKVTDVEVSDGDARAHYYSATNATATVDGQSVKPYDDTFIFRPYSETI